MACTLRVASRTAKLGQPEVNLGLIPGYGGTQRLPRLVGKGRALEMILTGDPVPADEAWRIGLVNRVVEPAALIPACRELAKKILSRAPLAVKRALDAVNEGLDLPLGAAEKHEAALFGLCASTEDWKEGVSAFLEKRPAAFTGR
jgi:enoyl-CoA hydratase